MDPMLKAFGLVLLCALGLFLLVFSIAQTAAWVELRQ